MKIEHNGITVDLEKIKTLNFEQYPWLGDLLKCAKELIEDCLYSLNEPQLHKK